MVILKVSNNCSMKEHGISTQEKNIWTKKKLFISKLWWNYFILKNGVVKKTLKKRQHVVQERILDLKSESMS